MVCLDTHVIIWDIKDFHGMRLFQNWPKSFIVSPSCP